MTQLNIIVNSLPRDLLEFAFFLIVGFTAGSVGLIWYHSLEIPKFLNFLNFMFFKQCKKIPVDNKNSNISWSFLICCVVEAHEISK